MLGGKVLVDGDIVAYRAAFSSEKDFQDDAASKVDEIMGGILEKTCDFIHPTAYEVYLTGRGNFRHEIAKSAPYKGNRKDRPKPIHLSFCKDYLVINYQATITEGQEADDAIAIRATELGEDTIVASVDKDFLQLPCIHYNIVRQDFTKIGEFEGLKKFYSQILTGDSSDNVYGIYKVGPKTAEKMLKECTTEEEMWGVCVEAYGGEERPLENAQLVWLRRQEGEIWQPPGTR